MNLNQYRAYLAMFNARDYDGVLAHFHDDAEVLFAGYCLRGHQAVRDFYTFFHAYVDETISLIRFISDGETVALEGTVRLEAKQDLPAATLAAKGLDGLVALRAGEVFEMSQFIHYHLIDGLFVRAVCAVVDPVRAVLTSQASVEGRQAAVPD